jgi:hypothetical protein
MVSDNHGPCFMVVLSISIMEELQIGIMDLELHYVLILVKTFLCYQKIIQESKAPGIFKFNVHSRIQFGNLINRVKSTTNSLYSSDGHSCCVSWCYESIWTIIDSQYRPCSSRRSNSIISQSLIPS